jgi:hypothetical protein
LLCYELKRHSSSQLFMRCIFRFFGVTGHIGLLSPLNPCNPCVNKNTQLSCSNKAEHMHDASLGRSLF